jgi:hypothetical protein
VSIDELPRTESGIEYINPDAPPVAPPRYPGLSYEALVPATLDLAERCRLSVNALTETLDPEADYELYWIVDLLADPPAMYHSPDDHVQDKFFQALPLVRTASGSVQNLDVEHALMQTYLRKQGPDGLIYIPLKGRPWGRPAGPHPWAGLDELPTADHWASLIMAGRVLGAFSVYALKDPSGPWLDAARRLAEGLRNVSIVEDDIAYFYLNFTEPGRPVVKPERRPLGFRAAVLGWAAQGLAQYHRVSGDPDALDLATRYLRWVFGGSGYFGPNGEFTEEWPDKPEMGQGIIHFHAHTSQILAAADVALLTKDEWLLERATAAYTFALAQGEYHMGYFPEYLHYRGGMYGLGQCSSELCEVADMVAAGVKLSLAGVDKWDDVDRWVRNMLTEGQLTELGWLTDGHRQPVDRVKHPLPVADWESPKTATTDRVAERVLGSFSGWPSANDFVHGNNWSIMHCCTGNGTRALYYVWEAMLRHEDGPDGTQLRVNLLANRASRFADIDSRIPYEGRVDVKVKEPLTQLALRLPEWVQPGQQRLRVNGVDRVAPTDGRYVLAGECNTGDVVTLEFPIVETTDDVIIEKHSYRIIRRGSEIVSVDPPGENHPIFLRPHYRSGKTLWQHVTRFVPEQEIPWA